MSPLKIYIAEEAVKKLESCIENLKQTENEYLDLQILANVSIKFWSK